VLRDGLPDTLDSFRRPWAGAHAAVGWVGSLRAPGSAPPMGYASAMGSGSAPTMGQPQVGDCSSH